MKTDTIGDMV
ncbi:hypothetical protein OXX79_013379, partial [Metschnikowia pulcherrima]